MTYTAKPGVRLFRHLDEQVEVTNPDVKTHQIDGLTVTEWPIKQPHKSLND